MASSELPTAVARSAGCVQRKEKVRGGFASTAVNAITFPPASRSPKTISAVPLGRQGLVGHRGTRVEGDRSPGGSGWKDARMRITVLTVPDCPNAPVVRQRIAEALDGRAAEVRLVEVAAPEDAVRWGMTGSPTVLVDGADLFAEPGASPSVSCRL